MIRPHISTNLAISADGKITTVGGIPSGWTSPADHARLLALRADADALLIGRGTLESDRMTLTVPGKRLQPLRCVVSRRGNFDLTHPLFQAAGGAIHLLITGDAAPKNERFASEQATIHRLQLGDFLKIMATDYGVQRLHCEGGGELIHALAVLDWIDEFHLTVAGHSVFGGAAATTASGKLAEFLPAARRFELSYFEPNAAAGECFLSYRRLREPAAQ
jgi:2,5-diamino-6-(ribosylamino)-4(3H)-pyrimidinone 5'-phosphate reductase